MVIKILDIRNMKLFYEDSKTNVDILKESLNQRGFLESYHLLHNVDSPAALLYDSNGKLYAEYWIDNGKFHRLDGPAIAAYQNDIIYFYLWDQKLNKKEYYQAMNYLTDNGAVAFKMRYML